ncbi:MAG: D-alanyl-D-alanine carboxypeptidase family protein [Oscillospiraceae bacterium]
MAKKPLYKRLKYKNIIITLAGLILLIMIISAACGHRSDGEDDADSSKASPQSSKQDSESSKVTELKLPKTNYKYESVENDRQLTSGELVLVNKDHTYTAKASDLDDATKYRKNAEGTKVFKSAGSTVQVKTGITAALNGMFSDFNDETGIHDVELVTAASGKAAKNSTNENETGYAFDMKIYSDSDVTSDFTGTGEYAWLLQNCQNYGFIVRYPDGKKDLTGSDYKPAHLRYVGLPHALIMTEKGWCLEEYLEKVKDYSYDNPLTYIDTDGISYAVYYTKAGDNTTNVKIPQYDDGTDYNYTISGNNADGFIVTVNLTVRSEPETPTSDDASAQ